MWLIPSCQLPSSSPLVHFTTLSIATIPSLFITTSLLSLFTSGLMGKKDRRTMRMRKRKAKADSLTPPLSDAGEGTPTVEETTSPHTGDGLNLDLQPMRLAARAPFNHSDNPADTVTLVSGDNVEFLVSRSVLVLGSPYFKQIILSRDQYSDLAKDKVPPGAGRNWEVSGVYYEVDESCSVLDGLLRFVYPIPSPVFKEPVTGGSKIELPYRLIGPILDAARRLEFIYVCQEIHDIVDKLIHIKSFPEPGLASLRAYAVACRIQVDYLSKLKAARNALCIPNTYYPNASSPTAGLETEGIRKIDIERFAEFHKRSVQVCVDLFKLSEPDKYPIGLPDVYASFVACARCSGVDPIPEVGNGSLGLGRAGAAHWWQLYAAKALERLRVAPLDPYIFFENYLIPIFREAKMCSACANAVHWKWCNMMPMLAREIPTRIYEVPLDVDDSVYDGAKESFISFI